ncbi:hypothetical protein B5E88_10480 [Enterococcus cecorum]|uniref:Uncharacterized protein n=1 Tax=Enterococcus cecorum TaxID=44008 RepID=A0A1Y4QUG9_9ENTE|nr:hypothetical protein [Enterococcus cecorum]OUQ08959.1 hypothetical protein B5E88_10480 [Enterococcus cecorum]
MFQIYYMGKYKDESQLIKNQPYPYQATQFKESDNLNKIFLQGLLIGLPLFIVALCQVVLLAIKSIGEKVIL